MAIEKPLMGAQRLVGIDLLRGLVMALMTVDHVRDFVAPTAFDPTDLSQSSVGFFLTRWVTHFCAPVFVLLAGVGIGLWAHRQADLARVRGFLVRRGLWLVAVELLVINPLWMWSAVDLVGYVLVLQVIWAIGVSMLCLAALLSLGPRWIGVLGALMVLGHNLFDAVSLRGPLGSNGLGTRAWMLMHEPGGLVIHGHYLAVVYPLVPWIGVLALGYCLAPIFRLEPVRCDRLCRRLGQGLLLGFLALRCVNLYGDPKPWQAQERGLLFSALSFFNCTKYPASLLYLMMTLGPALWLLPSLQRCRGALAQGLVTLGRVPFFFYVLHIALVPCIGALFALHAGLPIGFWTQAYPEFSSFVPSLSLVWILSLLVLLVLFPACRWFEGLKRRRRGPRDGWLRYL